MRARTAAKPIDETMAATFPRLSFSSHRSQRTALSHASNTVKVDKSLPLAMLAPLGCGVQTGAGTVFNTLEVAAGSKIAIFGCGCVGLSAVMAAQVADAEKIVAVDIQDSRLDMARQLGATECINSNEFESSDALASHLRESVGVLNYAIDTTGYSRRLAPGI